jgi:hypothetical protein
METNNQTDSEIIISPFAGGGSQVTGPTTFTVTNNGSLAVNIVGIAFNKPAGVGHSANMGNFGGGSSNSNSIFSTNTIIAPGASRTFTVTYSKSAGAAIGFQSGTIVITTAQGPSATVNVTFDIRADTPTDSGGTDTGTGTGTTGDGDLGDTDVGTTDVGTTDGTNATDAISGTDSGTNDGDEGTTDGTNADAVSGTDSDSSSGTTDGTNADAVSGTDSDSSSGTSSGDVSGTDS